MMRLYLPRVEARLRGITALWFCCKKGHLHTIPCREQEWDKELAYNRHFTQWTYNSYIIQSTHIVRLRTKPKEKKITQLLEPQSSQLGSTTGQHERNIATTKIFVELPSELGHTCTGISAHATVVIVSSESRGLNNLKTSEIKTCVTPMMRLYLPRVEARLRGMTALWFCRNKGHIHTIPCKWTRKG